jgi:hypothetical protein
LNPQGIFFSRQYSPVLRSLRKSLVNPNLFAIIAPPNGLSGFNYLVVLWARPCAQSCQSIEFALSFPGKVLWMRDFVSLAGHSPTWRWGSGCMLMQWQEK